MELLKCLYFMLHSELILFWARIVSNWIDALILLAMVKDFPTLDFNTLEDQFLSHLTISSYRYFDYQGPDLCMLFLSGKLVLKSYFASTDANPDQTHELQPMYCINERFHILYTVYSFKRQLQ